MKRTGKSLPSETNRKQAIKLRLASGPVANENTVPWWLEPVVFNGLICGVMEGSESNTNKEETRPEPRTGTHNYWVRGKAATSPSRALGHRMPQLHTCLSGAGKFLGGRSRSKDG